MVSTVKLCPPLSFGTQAWQEALARQPLFKEDYAVLGWITDGRTMHTFQAMREFNFDVVRATSSLFRLLVTGSVEILRPMLVADDDHGETPLTGLAAILDSMQPADESGATFDASPQAEDPTREPAPGQKSTADIEKQQAQTKYPPAPAVQSQSKSDAAMPVKPESEACF